MFDEIAIEKCLKWDHSRNIIMGLCQEHSHNVNLEFKISDGMDEVFKAINDDEIHYTSEVIIFPQSLSFVQMLIYYYIDHCWCTINSEQ